MESQNPILNQHFRIIFYCILYVKMYWILSIGAQYKIYAIENTTRFTYVIENR